MKKYCLITTYYAKGITCPSKEHTKIKFNYDGEEDDLYINFSDAFDPWNTADLLCTGNSRRKDLVYGKIFLLRDFIQNHILNKYEYVCHIDYSDTKFCKSYRGMMENFISKDIDLIISTEKTCWPYLEILESWSPSRPKLTYQEFKYLNSGAFISKTSVLLEILNTLKDLCLSTDIDFWDDQGVWQYYDLYVNQLVKDYTCEYFFSTALLDNTYYKKIENKIITKFDTSPYLIHDNSSFSLNLINTI